MVQTRSPEMIHRLKVHKYLKEVLVKMPTEQALDTLFRYYGSRNLLTEEFYEDSVKRGFINKMSNNYKLD